MEQVVVAAAYWVAGKLALLLAIPPGYATAVWPAAGLALAGMLLLGYRIWPGVLLGSFLINFWTSFDPSSAAAIAKSVTLALGIGAGAALQAAGGAWLVRRWVGFPNEFTDERAVIKLLVGCVPVSCFVSPTVGVTALFLAGVVPGSSCLFNWWTWWVGDTIGAMIFAPLALLWAVRPHNGVRRRQFSISVPLGLMFALVVVLFIHVSSWEHHRLQTDFERRADEWTQSLRKALDRHLEALSSLERFYASATQVSRLEFRALVQGLFPRFEGVQAVEWVPRVADAQRLASEETAAREGLAAFQISELDARGGFVRAAPRAEYFPVYDVQPAAGNERALGFDLASDPVRREAMDRARDTGQPIATGRVRLVQETSNQFGVLVFQPIYQPGQPRATVAERRQHLRGYICGVFRVGDMLLATLNGAERKGMEMRLHDEAAPAPERLLAGATLEAKPRSNIPPLRKANAFPFAGRQWAFEFSLPADYLAANRSWAAWTVLAAGLLFAGLLEAFLLVVTGRTARIEDMVEQRTEELQAANGELQLQIAERRSAETALAEKHRLLLTVINALPDRIYVKDRESRFLLHNAAEARGMGLADDASLVGRSDADFYHEELADLYRKDEESVLATGHPLLDREEPGFDLATKRNRWLLTTKVPLRNAHGEIVGLVGLGRDITERKEADLVLRRQRLAMDAAMDGMAVLDDAGKFLYINRAHATLFGYDSPDELLGKSWRMLYGPDEIARLEREIFPKLQADGKWQGEATARHQDGSQFEEGLSLTLVEGIGLICVCRNIDRQKQSEAALGRQLRRQAALAGLELAINQEHELQAVLDRITRMVDEFLPAAAASIILWDAGSETFTVSASTVPGQAAQSGAHAVRRTGGASREIINHRQPVVVNDVREDPHGANPLFAEFGMQAYVGVPLLADGQALGVLYAIDRAPRQYLTEDIDFLGALAHRAAAALVKVRLHESLLQAKADLEQRVRERTSALEVANHDLITSRERYAAAVRGTNDGIWDWNLLTNEDYFSDRWCELLGYPPGELRHHADTWVSHLHPDERDWVLEQARAHLEQRAPYDLECRMRTRSGDYRWFRARGQAVWNESGQPVRMAGSISDITERRRIEMERDRFFAQSPDLLAIGGFDGRLKRVNPVWTTLLGYPEAGLLAMPYIDLIFPEDRAAVEGTLQKLLQGQPLLDFEVPVRCQGGGRKWIQWNSSAVVGDQLFYAVGRDITERKESEERLRAYREQLRAVSAQLLQTEEAERRRIASDIHDQVGQTLAACRLKLGELEAALDDPSPKQQTADVRAMLEQAIQETRSLTFDLSPPVLHELGLGPTLEWLAEDHSRRHGLRVLCETHGRNPPPGELSVLLFRVVRELLVNVTKHAHASKARVRLSGGDTDIRIEVTDDGVGFEAARVPEPRGRSDGFGLFSIRDRLRFIGGRLELDSAPGRGTRVVVTAPMPAKAQPDEMKLP